MCLFIKLIFQISGITVQQLFWTTSDPRWLRLTRWRQHTISPYSHWDCLCSTFGETTTPSLRLVPCSALRATSGFWPIIVPLLLSCSQWSVRRWWSKLSLFLLEGFCIKWPGQDLKRTNSPEMLQSRLLDQLGNVLRATTLLETSKCGGSLYWMLF